MNILSLSLGGAAALTLAMAAPAQAQQTETHTGLPYCSRNMQDNCIQRGDVKRNDFENRQEKKAIATPPGVENPSLDPGPRTTPETGPAPDTRTPAMPGSMPETTPPASPGPEMTPDDPALPDAGVTE